MVVVWSNKSIIDNWCYNWALSHHSVVCFMNTLESTNTHAAYICACTRSHTHTYFSFQMCQWHQQKKELIWMQDYFFIIWSKFKITNICQKKKSVCMLTLSIYPPPSETIHWLKNLLVQRKKKCLIALDSNQNAYS